jgi:hypothetical protein
MNLMRCFFSSSSCFLLCMISVYLVVLTTTYESESRFVTLQFHLLVLCGCISFAWRSSILFSFVETDTGTYMYRLLESEYIVCGIWLEPCKKYTNKPDYSLSDAKI